MVTHLDMDASDLYGLPLERFTEERNALVRSLRQDGRREQAAEVSRLRKPSVAAWAVNQLVRTQRREIEALFDAGDRLQKAQADVLAGKSDAGSLRQASDSERSALDILQKTARGLLSSEGHELTQAKLERVSETLHAAAIDEHARDQMRDGCLVRELRHAGLGQLGAGAASKRRTTTKDQRSARLKSVRRAEAAARRELERAERTVDEAERRRDRAADLLRKAEEALVAARELAKEATRQHERTQRALEEP